MRNHTLRHSNNFDTSHLLQILITELIHLIWVLRCERVQERTHSESETQARWFQAINMSIRLTD